MSTVKKTMHLDDVLRHVNVVFQSGRKKGSSFFEIEVPDFIQQELLMKKQILPIEIEVQDDSDDF